MNNKDKIKKNNIKKNRYYNQNLFLFMKKIFKKINKKLKKYNNNKICINKLTLNLQLIKIKFYILINYKFKFNKKINKN